MFGTFTPFSAPLGGNPGVTETTHATYGPAWGESAVEQKIGLRGYDGGIHNSPFSEGRIKEPFTAPGAYHPFMFGKPRRRRLNMLSILQVMALPFGVFAITMYLFGFSVHNNAPLWCWFFVAFCVLLSFVFMFKAYIVFRRQRHERWIVPWYNMNDDDTWFLFLGCSILIGCILGALCGEYIFSTLTQNYYTLSLLHTYDNVDPISEGRAYLDAGAIQFKKDSYVDVKHSIGYKDGSVYCVAPIKLGTDSVVNFDFWAVGKDCCNGFPGDFNCFENRNYVAKGGLRVINDADIPFYKLAQMQANGEFKDNAELLKDGRLNTVDPIFLTWMKEPVGRIKSYWNDAVWIFNACLLAFFLCEGGLVCVLAHLYWKNRLWG